MDILALKPEELYKEKVRPLLKSIFAEVKYDSILISEVENIMNKVDKELLISKITMQNYENTKDHFTDLYKVITSSSYLKGKLYMMATKEEKELVTSLVKHIEDLFMVMKCTRLQEEKEPTPKERLGYDSKQHCNINTGEKEPVVPRERIPNRR